MAVLTWLHISDLHFHASQVYDRDVVLAALLADVARVREREGLRPDLVFVTGDVAYAGKADEYAAAGLFLDRLLDAACVPRERLLVVPGNHDVDCDRVSPAARLVAGALTDRERVNAILGHAGDRTLMLGRLAAYGAFIGEVLPAHPCFDNTHYYYVHTVEVRGVRVQVLGLNSAWAAGSDVDDEQGVLLGERQVREALAQAHGAELTLALLHHPLDRLRAFDREDSEAMLLDSCHFVLHGHVHRTAAVRLAGPDANAMVMGGGACYRSRRYPNLYNVVRLDLTLGQGEAHLRRYSDERGGFWTADTLTYRNVQDGVYRFPLRGAETVPPRSGGDQISASGGSVVVNRSPGAVVGRGEGRDSKI